MRSLARVAASTALVSVLSLTSAALGAAVAERALADDATGQGAAIGPGRVMHRRAREPIEPPDEMPVAPESVEQAPAVLLAVPGVDEALDRYAAWKKGRAFQVSAVGWHWWNVSNLPGKRGDVTYGYPGTEGTYFFALIADASWAVGAERDGKSTGFHVEGRARDQTKYAPFYDDKVWLYEAYGWIDAGFGKVKAGKVVKQFGIPCDNTFWGNIPYYDGMSSDPDWGLSWERTSAVGGAPLATMDTAVQYFFGDDGINSSLPGADAESDPRLSERHTLVARAVPKFSIGCDARLELGVSGLVGTIDHDRGAGDDETFAAGEVDASLVLGGLWLNAGYAATHGTQNLANYVTGGPSDASRVMNAVAQWKLGAVTPRVSWSRGEYDHPSGHQTLFDAGVQVELTRFLTLYLEYVRWDGWARGAPRVQLEDGFQIVVNWHF